jgi:hypothetical protein
MERAGTLVFYFLISTSYFPCRFLQRRSYSKALKLLEM